MSFSDLASRDHAQQLRAFGEPVTYIPAKGLGDPIEISAILDKPQIDQSGTPGYFADIHVDPAIVTNPLRGDQVIWADETVYVVAKVARPARYSMFVLALHRKFDA